MIVLTFHGCLSVLVKVFKSLSNDNCPIVGSHLRLPHYGPTLGFFLRVLLPEAPNPVSCLRVPPNGPILGSHIRVPP